MLVDDRDRSGKVRLTGAELANGQPEFARSPARRGGTRCARAADDPRELRCAAMVHAPLAPSQLREYAFFHASGLQNTLIAMNVRADAIEEYTGDAAIANDSRAPASSRAAHDRAFVQRCLNADRYASDVAEKRCEEDRVAMSAAPRDVFCSFSSTRRSRKTIPDRLPRLRPAPGGFV